MRAERELHSRLLQRSMTLVADAHDRCNAIAAQLASTREQMAASRALLERIATATGVLEFPYAVAAPVTDAPVMTGDTTPRTFAAVTELIDQVERAAPQDVDLAATLTANIRRAIHGDTDAALLIAVLLEGVVQTVLKRVPEEERREMIIALCTVLCDRINEHKPEQN